MTLRNLVQKKLNDIAPKAYLPGFKKSVKLWLVTLVRIFDTGTDTGKQMNNVLTYWIKHKPEQKGGIIGWIGGS